MRKPPKIFSVGVSDVRTEHLPNMPTILMHYL